MCAAIGDNYMQPKNPDESVGDRNRLDLREP
jgi:hypothetical protein